MAYSDASYLNCRLVEYLGYDSRKLVGGEPYAEIWRRFLEVLDDYYEKGEFVQRAVAFLAGAFPDAAISIPSETHASPDHFTQAAQALRSYLLRLEEGGEVRGRKTIDNIIPVLYSYYAMQIAYLLGQYDISLEFAETCLLWIKRAEAERASWLFPGGRMRQKALYYYRYLILTLLFEISLHRGSLYRHKPLADLLETTVKSDMTAILYKIVFQHLGAKYAQEIQRYLAFTLNLHPPAFEVHLDRGGSEFERCYNVSAKLRVGIEQYHAQRPRPALENLETVIRESNGFTSLECYSNHARLYKGRIFLEREAFKDALCNFALAEEYFNCVGNIFGEMRCWRHRAEVLEKQFRYRSAEELLTKVIDRCLKYNYMHDLGMAFLFRGRAKALTHRHQDAVGDFHFALRLFLDYTALDNVIDLIFWTAIALCRWHYPEERERKLSEGRGYLIARNLAQQVITKLESVGEALVLKRATIQDREFTELLFRIVSGDLSSVREQAQKVVTEWEGYPSAADVLGRERERIVIKIIELQCDGYSLTADEDCEGSHVGPKMSARLELVGMFERAALLSVPQRHEGAREEMVAIASALIAKLSGTRKGLINLLDEFSYYFVSRDDFLALVLISTYAVYQGFNRLATENEAAARACVEFLRQVSEFLNRERLVRLGACHFASFQPWGEATPLGRRLGEKIDREMLLALYLAYAKGLGGLQFSEPRVARVREVDEVATVDFLIPGANGEVGTKRVEGLDRGWLERYGCDVKGLAIIVQMVEDQGRGDWLMLPVSDIRKEVLETGSAFDEIYRRLQWEGSGKITQGPLPRIDDDFAEDTARKVWSEFIEPGIGIQYDQAKRGELETRVSGRFHRPRQRPKEIEMIPAVVSSFPGIAESGANLEAYTSGA